MMTTDEKSFTNHTLLIANRGEIAVRIIRTAKKLGLRTVSVYTPSDSTAPHVTLADIAVALTPSSNNATTTTTTTTTEGTLYLSTTSIIEICKSHNVTLVHPGYGFLSENAEFAEKVVNAGIGWLGPRADTIRVMGMKHEARDIVKNAAAKGGTTDSLSVVPGSEGLVKDYGDAEEVVKKIGLPVIFKASAGGGGLGMIVCEKMEDVKGAFESASSRAKVIDVFSTV